MCDTRWCYGDAFLETLKEEAAGYTVRFRPLFASCYRCDILHVEPTQRCPVCEHVTLNHRGDYEICDECGWEDEGPCAFDGEAGPNHMTLVQARINYRAFGAIDEHWALVRKLGLEPAAVEHLPDEEDGQ